MAVPRARGLNLRLRVVEERDLQAAGRIIYRAFRAIAQQHNFPPEFPSEQHAVTVATLLRRTPSFYFVLAEGPNGQPLGVNGLSEGNDVPGVGPAAVMPEYQGQGIGRVLMDAVLRRARERGFSSARLVQDAYNMVSLSLYASLGFAVREPLVLVRGRPHTPAAASVQVRRATPRDLPAMVALCREVYGFSRTGELREAVERLGTATVASRAGRLVGYATQIAFWGHAVAEGTAEIEALVQAAAREQGVVSFLVPTRNAELFRWALENGLRVVKPCNLMVLGDYRDPRGAFLPSVAY